MSVPRHLIGHSFCTCPFVLVLCGFAFVRLFFSPSVLIGLFSPHHLIISSCPVQVSVFVLLFLFVSFTPQSRHASSYHLIGRLFRVFLLLCCVFCRSVFFCFCVCVFVLCPCPSFAVPFEEDPRNPSIWYLDHNFLEGENKTGLTVLLHVVQTHAIGSICVLWPMRTRDTIEVALIGQNLPGILVANIVGIPSVLHAIAGDHSK